PASCYVCSSLCEEVERFQLRCLLALPIQFFHPLVNGGLCAPLRVLFCFAPRLQVLLLAILVHRSQRRAPVPTAKTRLARETGAGQALVLRVVLHFIDLARLTLALDLVEDLARVAIQHARCFVELFMCYMEVFADFGLGFQIERHLSSSFSFSFAGLVASLYCRFIIYHCSIFVKHFLAHFSPFFEFSHNSKKLLTNILQWYIIAVRGGEA